MCIAKDEAKAKIDRLLETMERLATAAERLEERLAGAPTLDLEALAQLRRQSSY